MSDNPEGPALLNVDIETSEAEARLSALNARMEEFFDKTVQGFLTGDQATLKFRDDLNSITAQYQKLTNENSLTVEKYAELNQQIDQAVANYLKVGETAEAAGNKMQEAAAKATFQGPGPAPGSYPSAYPQEQVPTENLEGFLTGSQKLEGKAGSLFGPGRAAMVAGRALDVPALSGLGESLYVVEGLKLAEKQFEVLNGVITATPGLLAPVIAQMTALGIPMAGLVAVAAPLVALVGGLVIGLKLYNDALQESQKLLIQAIASTDVYYKDIIAGTTASISVELQKAEVTAKSLDTQKALIQAQITSGEGQAMNLALQNGLGVTGAAAAKALFDQSEGAKALIKSLDDTTKASTQAHAEIDGHTLALKSEAVAANDAAVQLKIATDRDIQNILNRGDAEVRAKELIASGTAKAVQKELDGNAEKYKANEQTIADLKAYGAQLEAQGKSSENVQAAIRQLEDENSKLAISTLILTDNEVLLRVQGREAETAAIKKQIDANQELNKAREDYAKKRADAEQDMADKIFGAVEKEREAESQYHQGSLQDLYERNRIAVDTDRKLEEERIQTANKLEDIQTKEGQKELDLRTNFNRQLQDDQFKINQEYQKITVDGQRQQIEDSIDHQHKLADIQRQSHDGDMQALLDRNFLALAKSKVSDQAKVDQENESYRDREAKLARHLEYQKADAETKMAAEIAQENRNYNRKLEDAQVAANRDITQTLLNEDRKIAAIHRAEQQKLSDLTAMENYKITLLRHNLFDVEIPLYIRQEQAKMRLLEDTLNKIEQLQISRGARERFATESAGTPRTVTSAASARTYDDGGLFGAGEPFMKGDIMEMLQFGAQGFNLGGAAMVYPLQSGSATPSKGGPINFSPVINVSGADGPQATAEAIHHMMLDLMEEVFPQ